MKNDTDDNLEKLIHRELTKLPDLQAPETLIPRVLESIRSKANVRWWQRPWFQWPIAPKMLSLTLAVGLFSLMLSSVMIFWPAVASLVSVEAFRDWISFYSVIESFLTTLAGALLVILNTIGKFWLVLSLTIAFVAYASCVGIGTLCFRLAINKRQTDED